MKKSIFNIFTKWQHIYCGVNLFSGIKIILLQQDYDCYLNNPQQLDKDLYATLVAGGFIIEDGLDEYAMIIHRRNNAVFYNKNTFQLTILPTLECNFRCWYCYEQHMQSMITPFVYEKVKKYITHILENHPIYNFHLDWFGGEPLLYFDEIVKPLSLYAKSAAKDRHLHFRNTMTTNGYLIDDDMLAAFNDIELNGFQITLDGYGAIHNKIRFEKRGDDSYSKIIGNINKICQSVDNASVNLRINYTNKNIVGIGKIANDIDEGNRDKVYVSLQRVWQTRTVEDEKKIEQQLDNEIELFRSKGIKVNYNRVIYREGCRCYADTVQQSVVNYDGTLFKCTARNFADSNASIGHLNDDGTPCWNSQYFKYFLKPVFENEKCKECLYLPVCLGVCSQKFVEGGELAIKQECDPEQWAASIEEDLLQSLYSYITNSNQS